MRALRALLAGVLLVGVAGATAAWTVLTEPERALGAVRERLTICALPGLRCAPPGIFLHQRLIGPPPDPALGRPDPDTLVSAAWVDLRAGAVELILPPMTDRFLAVQVLDANGRRLALVTARAPVTKTVVARASTAGRDVVHSSTDWVWVVARLGVEGESDLPAANALQDAMSIAVRTK